MKEIQICSLGRYFGGIGRSYSTCGSQGVLYHQDRATAVPPGKTNQRFEA